MTRLGLFTFTLAACASAPKAGSPPRVRAVAADPPSFAALLRAGADETTSMREAMRITDLGSLAIHEDRDVCVRAAVLGTAPTKAWFEDDTQTKLGDEVVAPPNMPAMVPAGGPACARRGETIRLVADAHARAVLWMSP